MHPDILRQFVAERTRDLITEAGQVRQAREARHAQRRRLAAQQPGSRRGFASRSRRPRTAG